MYVAELAITINVPMCWVVKGTETNTALLACAESTP